MDSDTSSDAVVPSISGDIILNGHIDRKRRNDEDLESGQVNASDHDDTDNDGDDDDHNHHDDTDDDNANDENEYEEFADSGVEASRSSNSSYMHYSTEIDSDNEATEAVEIARSDEAARVDEAMTCDKAIARNVVTVGEDKAAGAKNVGKATTKAGETSVAAPVGNKESGRRLDAGSKSIDFTADDDIAVGYPYPTSDLNDSVDSFDAILDIVIPQRATVHDEDEVFNLRPDDNDDDDDDGNDNIFGPFDDPIPLPPLRRYERPQFSVRQPDLARKSDKTGSLPIERVNFLNYKFYETPMLYEGNFTYDEVYKDDIFKNMLEREKYFYCDIDFLEYQPEIDRDSHYLVIDWISSACWEFRYCNDTLHLAVSVVNRALQKFRFSPRLLHAFACTALIIAVKNEEHSLPDIQQLIDYAQLGEFKMEQVLKMEELAISLLDAEIEAPNSWWFATMLARSENSPKNHYFLMAYLLELSLLDHRMHFKFLPSDIGTAAFLLSVLMYKKFERSTVDLSEKLNERVFLPLVRLMRLYENIELLPRRTAFVKYSSKDYDCVARKFLKPPESLASSTVI